MTKGKLIALEGLDGAGKTTQCNLLVDFLKTKGESVSIYPLYRNDLVEIMLERLDGTDYITNLGSRYAVVSKVLCRQEWEIKNKISKGEYVILDKFLLTFFATEMVRGCSIDELIVMTTDVISPDITFYFDIDPKNSVKRKDIIGYRESGLDIANFEGKSVEYKLFKENFYPTEWVEKQYIDFQNKLRKSIKELTIHHKNKWGSLTKLNCEEDPIIVHEVIRDRLLL